MEDFLIREIDRLGEMLALIAKKLGLMDYSPTKYSISEVEKEFEHNGLPIELGAVLQQENPVWYLVERIKLSDRSLELFIDILFHSDLDVSIKTSLLKDAIAFLDGKGYYSFLLHSLNSD